MFGRRKKAPATYISTVIAAAGMSSRMNGIDKQQAPIDEVPVVIRTLAAFEACPRIDEVILVCREEMIPEYYSLIQEHMLRKVISVVGGGPTRQDSVFLGIRACNPAATHYAIHDGARPLVEGSVIDSCIDAALAYGAAAAGIPVRDTIKVRDEAGFVATTPPRAQLIAIQTPQIFEAGLYRAAMAAAQRQGRIYTDDCQLIEHAGKPVYISPGSSENIKITTPEDLAIAQAVLKYREEGPDQWMLFE